MYNIESYITWLDNHVINSDPKIEGWVDCCLFNILKTIYSIQQKIGGRDSLVEIVVHHERLFISFNRMCSPEEIFFAIDVFHEQKLNIDSSGKGGLEHFTENLTYYDRQKGKC